MQGSTVGWTPAKIINEQTNSNINNFLHCLIQECADTLKLHYGIRVGGNISVLNTSFPELLPQLNFISFFLFFYLSIFYYCQLSCNVK